MVSNKTIIEFSDVAFSFSNSRPLFQNLSLELKSGRFYLIKGPSGSGKSTFLRLINRLEDPTGGRVLYAGRPLSTYNPRALRRSILYIQQTPIAVDSSIRQNLLLGFSFKINRDLALPEDVVLKNRMDKFLLNDISLEASAQTLSVGQLQRLCFIRGLLLNPQVLLLDEPASALDEKSSRIVEETAEKLCLESGLTVLMVSHREFEPKQVKCIMLRVADGQVETSE